MDYNSFPRVTQPPNIKVKLFRHQLVSIYRMEQLEQNKFIETPNYIKETKLGINADLAGYGKTYSILGLIDRNKMEWDIQTKYITEKITTGFGNLIRTHIYEKFIKLPTNLILVSSSILNQWKKEISNTKLSVVAITKKRDIDHILVENYDIVLVIPSMYNLLIQSYSKYAWKRFIFDEPGHLRVSGMKHVQAGFYWFLTSTPNSIIPYHQACRNSMMQKIIQNAVNKQETFEVFFSDIIIKNNTDFVKASFAMPQTQYYYYQCYQPIYNIVAGFVPEKISKMIESGNINGVIENLGGIKTRNIVELVKIKKEKEIQNLNELIQNQIQNSVRVKHYQNKIQNLNSQISELKNRFHELLNQNCNICMEKIKNPLIEPNCQNLFCTNCLFTWFKTKNSCPLCRHNIKLENLIYIENEYENQNIQQQKQELPLSKTEQIIRIITNTNIENKKIIIFSEYNGSFKPICNMLKDNNIEFSLLKGNNNSRHKIINEYKYGKIPVIFLNSIHDCAGINLQETTDIILYHKLDLSIEKQIIARAERIGRNKPLLIHQLFVHI